MAKKAEAPTQAIPEPDPRAHIRMPKGMKMPKGLSLGQKAKLTLEGEVCGFQNDEYGGSVELKHPEMSCEAQGPMRGSMMQAMKENKSPKKGA